MQRGFEVVNLHGTASAVIAVPTIGENGNWFIGNKDTGVAAQGSKSTAGNLSVEALWTGTAKKVGDIMILNHDLSRYELTIIEGRYFSNAAGPCQKIVQTIVNSSITFGSKNDCLYVIDDSMVNSSRRISYYFSDSKTMKINSLSTITDGYMAIEAIYGVGVKSSDAGHLKYTQL